MRFDCIKFRENLVKLMCHGMIFSTHLGNVWIKLFLLHILGKIKQYLDSLTLKMCLESFCFSCSSGENGTTYPGPFSLLMSCQEGHRQQTQVEIPVQCEGSCPAATKLWRVSSSLSAQYSHQGYARFVFLLSLRKTVQPEIGSVGTISSSGGKH